MKVALVCIAKNEDNYIKEWVKYNKKLKFDRIFIYQNNWRTNLLDDSIEKIEFDGELKQIPAYNDFIQKNKKKFDWAAFFDVDEFLVLKKHKNIKEFIEDYKEFNGISINWALFGDNKIPKVFDENYSVLHRFTKRQRRVHPTVKSIVCLNKIHKMKIHNPCFDNGTKDVCVDTNYKEVRGPFNNLGDYETAQINHYFCKTKEEFKLKCERGRADSKSVRRLQEDFIAFNKNDVEDLTALNFYKNTIKFI